MLDYYDMMQLIQDKDILVSAKEKELEALKTVITNDIMHNVKIQQLHAEINELRIQRTYYSNMVEDQLTQNCVGGCCTSGSCRYKYF